MAGASAGRAHGLNIAIYADGAELEYMLDAYRRRMVDGFTTNPTLMAKARVPDYRAFARDALAVIRDLPISFQVLADDLAGMARDAHEIAGWGENVFVKVPITTTRGEPALPVLRELSAAGVRVNVTAVLDLAQIAAVADALADGTPAIISVFAGRVADTGRDPCPLMREAVAICAQRPGLQLLWGSPREVLNVYQAEECGCHIVALTADLLSKLQLRGKNLREFSRETVRMFHDDAERAGYTLNHAEPRG